VPLLQRVLEQEVEGAFDDGRRIAIRDLVREQVL
jgi:hypothetical protein